MHKRIVCAAVKYTNGPMLVGPRHFDEVMQKQYTSFRINFTEEKAIQGFLDNAGNFHTREEAWVIAMAANQVIYRTGGDTINGGRLFSENLY